NVNIILHYITNCGGGQKSFCLFFFPFKYIVYFYYATPRIVFSSKDPKKMFSTFFKRKKVILIQTKLKLIGIINVFMFLSFFFFIFNHIQYKTISLLYKPVIR